MPWARLPKLAATRLKRAPDITDRRDRFDGQEGAHLSAFRDQLYCAAGGHVFAPTVTLVNVGSSVAGNGLLPFPAGLTQS
jgi:hypothetical protein